jgi:hypothetical protein
MAAADLVPALSTLRVPNISIDYGVTADPWSNAPAIMQVDHCRKEIIPSDLVKRGEYFALSLSL